MSNQISSSTGNEGLIEIIRGHLLHEFTKHIQDKERRAKRGRDKPLPEYCDPWWWPLDPANELKHWGLLPGDDAVDDKFRSLRPKQPRGGYPHFIGSLGAKAGCVFVIGERPSFAENYGNYMWKLDRRLNLLRNLPELGTFLQQAPEFHVTDCIKFRGDPLRDRPTNEMLDISRRCLSAEFDLLNPKMVLVTCMAGEEVLQFLLHHLQRRHLRHSKFVVVPHWSREFNEDEWVTRVRDAVHTT